MFRFTRLPGSLLRPLPFAACLLVFLCGGAHAGPPRPALSTTPSPFNWVIPSLIPVVGHDANGTPDPRGEVVVIVRDLANLPVANSVVTIDFSNCTDLRLCSDPHDPAAVVNCAAATVTKVSDVNGEVRFRVVGCSVGVPGGPGAGESCARVYADGVLGGFPSVAIYDLSGCDGVGASDLSAWLGDFFGSENPARADFNGSGDLSASDLTLMLDAFFAAGSLFNCSPGGRCLP